MPFTAWIGTVLSTTYEIGLHPAFWYLAIFGSSGSNSWNVAITIVWLRGLGNTTGIGQIFPTGMP